MNKPNNVEEWDGYEMIPPNEITEEQKQKLISQHEEYIKSKSKEK